MQPPILTHDDGISPLQLRTDASKVGLGAVLLINKDGELRPVTYVSKKLLPNETRYHSNELECYALVWTLDKFHHHVLGRPVLVSTDDSVLTWVFRKRSLGKSDRLARWVLQLQKYDFTIRHLKGRTKTIADFLSRYLLEEAPTPTRGVVSGERGKVQIPTERVVSGKNEEEVLKETEDTVVIATLEPMRYITRDLEVMQRADPEIHKFV